MLRYAKALAKRTAGYQRGALVAILWLGAALSAYCAVRRPADPAQPGLLCSPPVMNLGDVSQNEITNCTFEILNNYKQNVELLDVLTGCSCQTATSSRKYLGSGDRSTVTLTWSVGTRRGASTATVWVMHSVPGESEPGWTPLHIQAQVIPDINLEPKQVAFRSGVPETQRVKIAPGKMREYRIDQPYTNTKAVQASYSVERSEVEIRYTPSDGVDGTPGLHVAIPSSSRNEPVLIIPVAINRVGP